MPTSWYQATTVLMERIMALNPSSVLDVGVGFGKYGVHLREALDIQYERYDKSKWTARIDGIEAYGSYRNPLHDYIYNTVYYQPVSDCIDNLGTYDVVLMSDVLEHLPKEQGMELIKKMLPHAGKALIVSTPINPESQGDMDNSFEVHRSRWTPIDFAKFDIDFYLQPIQNNFALIVRIYPGQEGESDKSQWIQDTALINLIKPVREDSERLHIAYVLPYHILNGAIKMLAHQMRFLKARGHTVDIYLCSLNPDMDANASALPDWMPIEVDRDIVVPHNEQLQSYMRPCDVIIPALYRQIPDLLPLHIPVMYWEQGSEELFGHYGAAPFTEQYRNYLRDMYSQPAVFASVSDFAADTMKERFYRNTYVIPCGIDTDLYRPIAKRNEEPVILLVGNPHQTFKRFSTAIWVLIRLWNEKHKFRVLWISQAELDVSELPFPIQTVYNPPQESLAKLYASADILLSPSLFEAFGLPPLEAMAAGLAVVCTDCGGVGMFAVHERNALIVQPDDQTAMHSALVRLLYDEALRGKLSVNARETALRFSSAKSFSKLEELLYAIKNQNDNNAG